jgi:pyrimidine deaminase RibD-like protein
MIQCPLGPGLLCTVRQLLGLILTLLQSNPNIQSVVLADNQVLGLNISPQQVQALAQSGALTSSCNALQQINVVVRDPACP